MSDIKSRLEKSITAGEMVNLATINWPAGKKVLILAPHSDDFDAVAVTLKTLFERGSILRLVVLCLDNGVDADFEPQTPQAEIRKREQLASLSFFGLPLNMVSFPETSCDDTGQVADTPANRILIKKVLDECQPGLVFLPHWNDTNPAHRSVTAMFRDEQIKRSGLIALHNHDPKTTEMLPNAFMPFDETVAEWKGEMLRHHISQHSRNLRSRGYGFDDRLLSDNRNSAKTVGCEQQYAELFEIR